jgi:hypothetical protein
MSATKLDQADVIAQNAQLTADLAIAKQTIATLTAERDTAKASLTAEQDRVTALTSEVAALKAEKQTLDTAVAKKVATLGIKDNAEATAETKPTDKKLTLTERVLAAQGCKTLAESEKKYRDRVAANPGL